MLFVNHRCDNYSYKTLFSENVPAPPDRAVDRSELVG